MPNYTANYQLHQWVETDPFLRTDFNADFAAIDAALHRNQEALTPVYWDLYNLILQNEYEGKYTGWKRGLHFEGFMEKPSYGQLTEGFFWDEANHQLCLDGTQQPNVDLNYGTASSRTLAPGETFIIPWTATGSGWVESILVHATGGGTFGIALEYPDGANILFTTRWGTGETGLESTNLYVTRGTYRIRVTNSSNGNLVFYAANSSASFGAKITVRRGLIQEGTFTGKPLDHGLSLHGLRGWVRYRTGTVTPYLETGDGTWTPLPITSKYFGKLHNGEGCDEISFALDFDTPRTEPLTFRLDAEAKNTALFSLFDFGVALL